MARKTTIEVTCDRCGDRCDTSQWLAFSLPEPADGFQADLCVGCLRLLAQRLLSRFGRDHQAVVLRSLVDGKPILPGLRVTSVSYGKHD